MEIGDFEATYSQIPRSPFLLLVIFRPAGRKITNKRREVPCCRNPELDEGQAIAALCTSFKEKNHAMSITSEPFGTTAEGTPIERYTLTNANGLRAAIITYGGILNALRVPDRDGALGDIVLGFDTLKPYLGDHPFFGALVGRFCNRIAGAKFTLNGTTYPLARNDGSNHLHGGPHGFHRAIWHASER